MIIWRIKKIIGKKGNFIVLIEIRLDGKSKLKARNLMGFPTHFPRNFPHISSTKKEKWSNHKIPEKEEKG
jgi:hypothetical protein